LDSAGFFTGLDDDLRERLWSKDREILGLVKALKLPGSPEQIRKAIIKQFFGKRRPEPKKLEELWDLLEKILPDDFPLPPLRDPSPPPPLVDPFPPL